VVGCVLGSRHLAQLLGYFVVGFVQLLATSRLDRREVRPTHVERGLLEYFDVYCLDSILAGHNRELVWFQQRELASLEASDW